MRRFLLSVVLVLGSVLALRGAEDVLRYRVQLMDKHGNHAPGLSAASLERRWLQNIPLDSADSPVYEGYVRRIAEIGGRVLLRSRWMNTVLVSVPDAGVADAIRALPFVGEVRLVWAGSENSAASPRKKKQSKIDEQQLDTSVHYGVLDTPVRMLGLSGLHQAGHKGAGILVAVLDAGFPGVDTLSRFSNIRRIAAKSFIPGSDNPYGGVTHGTSVLSLMAMDEPGIVVGSAPEASYCLLRTEDAGSEFPVEEDYWIAAAEFADSIGARIITSSLGYTQFDSTSMSYQKSQLDGKSVYITKAAQVAVSRGMLVVVSAGNDGKKAWQKIGFPADASDVLTVGSVTSDGSLSSFSSLGPTADGRIKPDVMAMGSGIGIVLEDGRLAYGSGTSYSAPLVAGMAASLWGALPTLKAKELIQLIRESGDRWSNPDTLMGYGIPNAQKLWISQQEEVQQKELSRFYCYPNPTSGNLRFADLSGRNDKVQVVVYNAQGQRIVNRYLVGNAAAADLSGYPRSIYLVHFLIGGVRQATQKILLQP